MIDDYTPFYFGTFLVGAVVGLMIARAGTSPVMVVRVPGIETPGYLRPLDTVEYQCMRLVMCEFVPDSTAPWFSNVGAHE